MVAVLVGQSPEARTISPEEVEVMELLASQAGRALEGARRFEFERQTVERLEELDQMKTDFLTTVSHELRTPLTAIRGMGRTLEERWPDLSDEVRLELVGRLNSNASTLHGIIATLLDFSRIEAGKLEAAIVPVEIKGVVNQVADRLHGMLANHPWSSSVDSGLVAAADPLLLDRVFENLIANAVAHTPPGTRIAVTATPISEAVLISVIDTGPGIPAEDLARMGERFFRGGDPNNRPAGGTGLGLAFVREVLAMHDSELVIDSAGGVGSSFSFRLPVVQVPSSNPV